MPRKVRVEYAGAIYHVMSRGNRGDAIFEDDADRVCFLKTLDEVCERTGWLVHVYVLMGNHYHLLLETPEPNLVAGMKWLQGTYTQRFNARHKVCGHLFQGRYKAIPVDGDCGDYFATLSSYIHLNPVRARLFDIEKGDLIQFAWSSYPLYFDASKRPDWLCVDRVLGSYGVSDSMEGLDWYHQYMQERVLEANGSSGDSDTRLSEMRRGWFMGSELFRDELLKKMNDAVAGRHHASYSGTAMRMHHEAEAERLLGVALDRLSLSQEQLVGMKKGCDEKMAMVWLLKGRTVVSNEWIARHVHCGHPANISGYVRKVAAEHMGRLFTLRSLMEEILKSED